MYCCDKFFKQSKGNLRIRFTGVIFTIAFIILALVGMCTTHWAFILEIPIILFFLPKLFTLVAIVCDNLNNNNSWVFNLNPVCDFHIVYRVATGQLNLKGV